MLLAFSYFRLYVTQFTPSGSFYDSFPPNLGTHFLFPLLVSVIRTSQTDNEARSKTWWWHSTERGASLLLQIMKWNFPSSLSKIAWHHLILNMLVRHHDEPKAPGFYSTFLYTRGSSYGTCVFKQATIPSSCSQDKPKIISIHIIHFPERCSHWLFPLQLRHYNRVLTLLF